MAIENLRARGGRGYGELAYKNNAWILSDIEPHVAIKLKAIFPSIHKATTGSFKFPANDNICADLWWFLQRYPMRMKDAHRKRLDEGRDQFERARDELEDVLTPNWMPPSRYGFKPGYELWHLQAQAVEIVHRKKVLLLGDTLGMGKTFTALGAIVGSPYLPAAVLAKTHLPLQWVDDFITPATYLSAHIIERQKPYKLPPANVYIFKYSNIAYWTDLAASGFFKAFIADEVHELRTGASTDKGKAARIFADHAELKLPMSGTPVFNYGDEIFNILDIFAPGVLGEREEFYREWCVPMNNHQVVKDPDALGTYLRELQIFLRREREGRPVNKQPVIVEYDATAEEESRYLAAALAEQTLHGTFEEAGMAALKLDAMLRQNTGVGKARGVAGFARMLLSQDIPIILFGWHREVYNIWLKELAEFNPVMFTGSEDARKKNRAKTAFMRGDTNVILMSLRSGDGIDGLQHRCSTVVFGEYDWTPQVHNQAIGRVDRPYQKKDVIDAFYCHVNEGSDPSIIGIHGLKASQARGITNPLAGVAHVYRDEQRVKMLAQNYLKQIGK